MSCRLVAGRVRKSHENLWNTMRKEGSASVAVVWCRLMTDDKTLLLISGSQVRVLVRPPNISSTYRPAPRSIFPKWAPGKLMGRCRDATGTTSLKEQSDDEKKNKENR